MVCIVLGGMQALWHVKCERCSASAPCKSASPPQCLPLPHLSHSAGAGQLASSSSFWKAIFTRSCGLSISTKPCMPAPVNSSLTELPRAEGGSLQVPGLQRRRPSETADRAPCTRSMGCMWPSASGFAGAGWSGRAPATRARAVPRRRRAAAGAGAHIVHEQEVVRQGAVVDAALLAGRERPPRREPHAARRRPDLAVGGVTELVVAQVDACAHGSARRRRSAPARRGGGPYPDPMPALHGTPKGLEPHRGAWRPESSGRACGTLGR